MKIDKNLFLNSFFIFSIFFYLAIGLYLVFSIPYGTVYGGPDEVIHISLAEYIAKYHHWAYWDSDEILKAPIGVSYTTGSSLIYWLHGLTFELFEKHRIGAYIVLITYLSISSYIFLKNKLAGFILIATLLPQTLFIFSYVNSDAGTLITALLFGLGVSYFIQKPYSYKHLFILFFLAGFTVTARQSLWPLSLTTLILLLLFYHKIILTFSKKILFLALLFALIPASWWFYTSYIYNAHDILGIFTTSKSILKFGNPNFSPTTLAKPWSEFILINFIDSIWKSMYGVWGWMNITLNPKIYILSLISLIFIYISIIKNLSYKIIFISLLLILINFGFMLIYSTHFDYQAQGRYLFPSFYIIIGLTSGVLMFRNINLKLPIFLSILLIIINIYSIITLIKREYIFKPINNLTCKNNKLYPKISSTINLDKNISILTDGYIIIDNAKISQNTKSILLNGWAVDIKNNILFNNIYIKINNSYFKAKYFQPRKDVAKHFKNNDFTCSGFSASIPLTLLKNNTSFSITVISENINKKFKKNNTILLNRNL